MSCPHGCENADYCEECSAAREGRLDREGAPRLLVVTSERGWPGHFIGGGKCVFHRNTLIEGGDVRVVVSTVGNYRDAREMAKPVGIERWYETMAFMAKKDGPYWEISVTEQVEFGAEWAIHAKRWEDLPDDVDVRADAMHNAAMSEICERLATKGAV